MTGWSVRRLDNCLGEYAQGWDALHARLFRANPMLDSRFVDAALKHFGTGNERLGILHVRGVPRAMCVLQPAGAGRWTTFLPSQMQIGPVLLGDPEPIARLIRRLPGLVVRVDFLCNDPDFGDLTQTDDRTRASRDHALTMYIHLSTDFANYWAARPKKLIQNIGRYQRRVADAGISTRLVRVDAPDQLAVAVARYAQLEQSGWKRNAGTALDLTDAQGRFYLEVMDRFAQTAGATAYELWFDGRLAASRLTLASGDCIVMLKTTYDEALAQFSPGRLLLKHVIEDLFNKHGASVIEFYTDANVDLLAWATGQRWIRHVTFDRTASTSKFLDLVQTGRHALKLRPSPPATGVDNERPDRVEVYHHPGELPAAVRHLFDATEASSVDLGLSWYGNLVDTVYRDNPDVHFYTVWNAGQPVAALPVLISKTRWGQQAQSLANFYSALYAPALSATAKPEDLVPLLHAIRDAHAPMGSFRLAPMDPGSREYHCLLSAMRSARMAPFQFFCFGNWYMQVHGSWEAYLAAREGALRSTIKRMGKKFAKEGGELEIIHGGPELERAIQAYESVYATSWKKPEPYPDFMPGLIRLCAERGWLRLGVARMGERAVAAQIWIVANGKASIYKLAYDENYKAYATGTLLTAMLMQHVIEQDKVGEVDYLIGDDSYKKTWVNERRERWGLIAYNPTTIYGMIGLLWEIGGRLVRRLKPSK